jgi:hypothetical protein
MAAIVPQALDDPVRQALDDPVPQAVDDPVPQALDGPVPQALDDPVTQEVETRCRRRGRQAVGTGSGSDWSANCVRYRSR